MLKLHEKLSSLSLQENENAASIAFEYGKDRRLQIPDVLPEAQIQKISHFLANQITYKNAIVLDGKTGEVSIDKWRSFSDEERHALMTKVMAQAAEGVGFWYGRCGMSAQSEGVLKEVFDWLNSEELLGVIRKITGIEELRSASGQATRFLPGEFLTRHQDVVAGEKRKIAYVLNCT